MNKLFLFLFLFFAPYALFCADYVWDLPLESLDTEYYRYRVRETDEWTYIEGSEESVLIENLDSSDNPYVFFQTSSDNENWSEEERATLRLLRQDVKEKDESDRYSFSLSLVPSLVFDIEGNINGELSLGLEFRNIVYTEHMGLTLRLDFDITFFPSTEKWDLDIARVFNPYSYLGSYRSEFLFVFDTEFDNINLYTGAGAGYSMSPWNGVSNTYYGASHTLGILYIGGGAFNTALNAVLNLGLRYSFGFFSVGLEASYRLFFPSLFNTFSVGIVSAFAL